MDKTKSILDQELFSVEDRKKIIEDPYMRFLFICSGLVQRRPKFINSCWTLDAWQAREKSGGIDLNELYFEDMANNGGKCDVCDKPWKKIENSLGLWHYEPNCTCYPRCPFCKRWLFNEVKKKQAGCFHCCKNGIGCIKKKPVLKKDSDGNVEKTGIYTKCKGIMELQPAKEGFTVYKCNICGNLLKRRILTGS